jgi:hypothetical protein
MYPPTVYYSKVGLEVAKLVFQGQKMSPPYVVSIQANGTREEFTTYMPFTQEPTSLPIVLSAAHQRHPTSRKRIRRNYGLERRHSRRNPEQSTEYGPETARFCWCNRCRDFRFLHRGRNDWANEVGRLQRGQGAPRDSNTSSLDKGKLPASVERPLKT